MTLDFGVISPIMKEDTLQSKKELVYSAVKKSGLFDPEQVPIELVANDILCKSSFIFEIGANENEIFDYLMSLADASIKKVMEDTKGANLQDNIETMELVPDPKTLCFDISDEALYLKKLLIRLYNLDSEKSDKDYAAIFYERYIQKLKPEVIEKMHNIDASELNSRLLDIARAVNNEKK